ncbi:TraR/DksA family transcriptional regulator [Planctomonas deserti]|uniref:TraR/DksA family transcriptional regulator n=1 Tax=Planctomonas deserti TaxID=2144185 RepID=UPI000D341821|nr:TraR/DksA C4-type zinc finger protein [Planctomonas deserti]
MGDPGHLDLEHFGALLAAQRAEREAEAAALAASLSDVRAARSDGTADDEHDPEGSTLSSDWSRISGLLAALRSRIDAIERAGERIDAGTYGICLRRGERIPLDRLEALPAAELCIACAREAEVRR